MLENSDFLKNSIGIGSAVPPFALQTDAGLITPEALSGSWYILYFYPKDDTKGCTAQAQDFSRLRSQFDKAGIKLFGVSKDSLASHQRFAAKHAFNLTLASDPETHAAQAFGVWVEKSLYGRKYLGIERSTFIVDRLGIVRYVWRKVRVEGHAEQVLNVVLALAT